MATLTGGTGNDSLSGAAQNDIITGAAGNDTLIGGAGNDSLIGSAETATTVSGVLSWASLGRDEGSIAKGATATVAGMTVSVGFSQDVGKSGFTIESSDTAYVAPGETFSATSNLEVAGPGNGQSTTTVSFAAATGGGMEANVQNVAFRLNDIDTGGWTDRVTVLAYDALGAAVPVSLTASGNDIVSGATITGAGTSDSIAVPQGSALVQVAGPVARIEIVYGNLGGAAQVIYLSDIQFAAVRVDNDLLQGGTDSDTLIGGYGNDTLLGEDGGDLLYGGAGRDSVLGGAGNDTLAGGAGGDYLDGGLGNDIVDYAASGAAVSVNLTTRTATGGHAQGDTLVSVDGVIGSAFDDTLIGYDQQSNVAGDSYTNALSGGAGNDLLDGAAGDDLLYGGADNDTVRGGTGNDWIDGGTGNDSIDGGDGADSLYGGDGNDRLEDTLGSNILDGGAGADTLLAGAGRDTIYGGDGNDLITDTGGANLLSGGAGEDVVSAGAGNDSIDGGDGADTLSAGAGDDTVAGDAGNDLIYGGDGNDRITDSAGTNRLYGGAGNDALSGGSGADSLYGDGGDDVFTAAAGDYVDGGAGNDRMAFGDKSTVRVVRNAQLPGSGRVDFLDAQRHVVGSLTYDNVETVVPCFTPGCRIAIDKGAVRVESIRVGDRLRVRDGGFAVVRWVGHRRVGGAELAAQPGLRPVEIDAGALGPGLPRRGLVVSPQHRLLFSGGPCALLFGEEEVLVPAQHLVGLTGVRQIAVASVDYIHFMFDRHQLVRANGLWTESFQPGDRTLAGLDKAQRAELLALFPDLADPDHAARQAVRPSLRAHEAQVLLGALVA